MDMMKKMMENMNEEERVRMMERCFEFLKGKERGKDKDREDKKKEESPSFPDMSRMAEGCPEMMEAFFRKMKSRFEEAGEEKRDTDEKEEKTCCC